MTQQEEAAAGSGLGRSTVQRVFRLLFDVRSFKSNRKFPFNRSKVVVVVSFPDTLEEAINTDPTKNLRIGQLRSRPAVEVARGSEVLIPNSFLEVNFTTTALRFASTLADDPHCKVQIFREDRYRSDMLLGEALVPLQPLLTQPWIDGYAPVMAMDKSSKKTGAQLGAVRIVVAVEEVGVLSADEQAALQSAESSQAQLSEFRTSADVRAEARGRAVHASDSESESVEGRKLTQRALFGTSYLKQIEDDIQTASEQTERDLLQAKRAVAAASPLAKPAPPPQVIKPSTSVEVEQITQTQEYASAWEFEVWRSAEEARWHAEMKEKEIARLAYIQKEWKKREKERLDEIGRAQEEVESLQKNLKKSLLSVEEREKKLIMAEEALSRRRKEIDREAATRALEAQAAIQRTKDEYQCKLDIEKAKSEQITELQHSTENRLHRIQASFDKLEREYQEYREKMRTTSESELQMQILSLQSELQNVREDKLKLQHSRVKQKDVISKLQRELQWAQSMIQQEHTISSSGSKYNVQAKQLNEIAQTGLKDLKEDQEQLKMLREQVMELRRTNGPSKPSEAHGKADGEEERAGTGEAAKAEEGPQRETSSSSSSKAVVEAQVEEKNFQRERLEEEMSNLLQSGMYTETDPIILTLKEKISLL
ncbi:hypothetical protein A3770_02p15910 [Chloropicon primus]|uniref:Uncharacterized protein n=1 Tax=Chloropicon primus TaxID=1764295 RepID=A0A5B8MF32_9CHLO|nr:hypothetical protein A3770_02p15910 [Chloropicon primus]|eukprot:QDZ19073.1 hypothetical protein A3770_02p15910 [Chloropicon primus]